MSLVCVTSDGKHVPVSTHVLNSSLVLQRFREEFEDGSEIPLPSLSSELGLLLFKIVSLPETTRQQFVEPLSNDQVFGLIMGANYLEMPSALECLCSVVVSRIEGKTPEELRTMFNLPDDLTKEDHAVLDAEFSFVA